MDGTLYFAVNGEVGGVELWVVRSESSLVGDLNGDGRIDGSDLGIVFANWSRVGVGDLNTDGIVDGADVALIYSSWTGDSTPIVQGVQNAAKKLTPTAVPSRFIARPLRARLVDAVMPDKYFLGDLRTRLKADIMSTPFKTRFRNPGKTRS